MAVNFFESPWDFESGKIAEQALVIILVLNLLFWLIVIIWRFCYIRKLNAVVERSRAEMRGRINDGLESEQQRGPEDDIYALSRGDFPPSYDDAIKSHPIFPPEPSTSPPPQAPIRTDSSVRPRTTVDDVADMTSSPSRETSASDLCGVEVEESVKQNIKEATTTRIQIDEPPPLPSSPPPVD
ncbi:uncharacterized protein LOC100906214 isoform X1 [Galendromus occidentalis]|uniref:Uncharacterized protein LOC100906214 isoform X1 n=1 Tax=Galendromus occidentalis TaxID=34638 RepID=A0AAJ6QTV9_9ACAR|nr:uncharacterized protein LOC100906214 isoform X1 [Galendromus occidentalis]